uniref:Plakophilin-4 n=1 Tax=Syphacia muris TaxID=451379 RepID=A0A0N5AJK3_9BILA
MELYTSPSYHLISPLVHSNSSVSNLSSSPSTQLRRTQSYVQSTHLNRHYTMPRYGYGGGYMSRSLSRNESTLFGRSLQSSVLTKTPPFHSVALQRSTPHYTDKYPYVRYSYGNLDTGLSLLAQTEALGRSSSVQDLGTKRWLEGNLSSYNSRLFSTPSSYYNYNRVERPIAPTRNYIRIVSKQSPT